MKRNKSFLNLIPKDPVLQVCLAVSTCIQYYFKGFSLKTVSAPNQTAGWTRETFCLPVTLPTTCLRVASFPKDPSHLAFLFPAVVPPLPISSRRQCTLALWDPPCVRWCVLCVTLEQHRPGFRSCPHWLLVDHVTSLHLSLAGMGTCPSLNGCDWITELTSLLSVTLRAGVWWTLLSFPAW